MSEETLCYSASSNFCVSPSPPLLPRFRKLLDEARASAERAEEILSYLERGPCPKTAEWAPCPVGLEDIYDALHDAIRAIGERLARISDKLGE